jgi:hypothetical protein
VKAVLPAVADALEATAAAGGWADAEDGTVATALLQRVRLLLGARPVVTAADGRDTPTEGLDGGLRRRRRGQLERRPSSRPGTPTGSPALLAAKATVRPAPLLSGATRARLLPARRESERSAARPTDTLGLSRDGGLSSRLCRIYLANFSSRL